MRELIARLPQRPFSEVRHVRLLDTCFLVDLAERNLLHRLLREPVAVTSFNLLEVDHIHHRLKEKTKESLRHFLRVAEELLVVEIPVVPGDREAERRFVESVDSSLLQKVRDPSDAVLIATAIVTRSDVYTKDKHHLFTVQLENYLHAYDLVVRKEWSH